MFETYQRRADFPTPCIKHRSVAIDPVNYCRDTHTHWLSYDGTQNRQSSMLITYNLFIGVRRLSITYSICYVHRRPCIRIFTHMRGEGPDNDYSHNLLISVYSRELWQNPVRIDDDLCIVIQGSAFHIESLQNTKNRYFMFKLPDIDTDGCKYVICGDDRPPPDYDPPISARLELEMHKFS